MTSDEFERLRHHLFVAFPDLYEWLEEKSPDMNATLALWHKSLADCTLVECMCIIDDWLTAKRPVFKGFEKSQVAIIMRQSVLFDRAKANKKNAELSEHERVQTIGEEYRKTRDKNYKPLPSIVPELRPIYERGAALKREVMDGKISQAEFERRKAALLDEVK